MKIKILLSILVLGLSLSAFNQNTMKLAFSAIDSTTYIQLDSIKIMNRTQGGDTVLHYPDTTLMLNFLVGVYENNNNTKGLQLLQNFPNPVTDQTTISFYIPERDKVSLFVTDMLGHELINTERILDVGYHSYQFMPGNGSFFLFTLKWREYSLYIKILKTNSVVHRISSLEYLGRENSSSKFKVSADIQNFPYSFGDELLYIGYFDSMQSGILDKPQESKDYTFQFAHNIPCLGTPTIEYEGQAYNTIQIMSQCWLKENLNVGDMISGDESMTDNGILEKYCYNNEPDSCNKYGGLYQWKEMMQYTTQQGVQGICPTGWHLPTDEEWKVLEGVVDSIYGIGNVYWDAWSYRGHDAGNNLKTVIGWPENGNGTDRFGFSGLPGGFRWYNTDFMDFDGAGSWWTSTETLPWRAFQRTLSYLQSGINRYSSESINHKSNGYSVRCLKD